MGPSVCTHWLEEIPAEKVILPFGTLDSFFSRESLITFSHRIDSVHDLWISGSMARGQGMRSDIAAIEFTDPNFRRPPAASEITWTLEA
jgi:hypothetical protein